MDAVLYIVMLACLGLVAGWYVINEMKTAHGAWGLLSIKPERETADDSAGESYRRREDRKAGRPDSPLQDAATPKSYKDASRGQSFRDRTDARYRSRGPLPRYGERSKNPGN